MQTLSIEPTNTNGIYMINSEAANFLVSEEQAIGLANQISRLFSVRPAKNGLVTANIVEPNLKK
jgi:hypothetical protein